ncbi:MAG: hypothetical protein V1821_00095 [bacterium]
MIVLIFGNPDLRLDNLPVRLLPKLRAARPDVEFVLLDPNEEWPSEHSLIVIDTVFGISEPRVFDDLESFQGAPRFSGHDFDAYTNLRFLKKIGKLDQIKIFGLPNDLPEEAALAATLNFIRSISP